MSGQCPALSLINTDSIAGVLSAMDCQIGDAVETGYNRMFGAGGAFADVLTAALTIYIALMAYSFLTGRTKMTVTMLSPRLIAMVLVITFITFWPAYHTLFYAVFMNGPDQIAAALLDEKGSALISFAQHLDMLVSAFSDIGSTLQSTTASAATATATAAKNVISLDSTPQLLFWASGIILLLSTLGVLLLTRMVLYLLLILGPVFILLGLFEHTRGLFQGWMKSTLLFALAPMLTILGGNIVLSLFAPVIGYIGQQAQLQQDISQDMRPILVLFVGSLIYAAFLFVLMRMLASLVREWHAPRDNTVIVPAREAAAGTQTSQTQSTQPPRGVVRTSPGDIPFVTSQSRSTVNVTAAARTPDMSVPGEHSGITGSRVHGLGQRFRTKSSANTTGHTASSAGKGSHA